MGFGDRFKGLADQAKEKVAENRERIQGAVDAASVAANERTHGKYANRINKVNQRTGSTLDRLSAEPNGDAPAPVTGEAEATAETPRPDDG